jgi:hypothetical protein
MSARESALQGLVELQEEQPVQAGWSQELIPEVLVAQAYY